MFLPRKFVPQHYKTSWFQTIQKLFPRIFNLIYSGIVSPAVAIIVKCHLLQSCLNSLSIIPIILVTIECDIYKQVSDKQLNFKQWGQLRMYRQFSD